MKLPFFLARKFVAGEDFDHALPRIQELNDKNIQVTLDKLGENVDNKSMASESAETYRILLDKIDEAGLDSTISVKLTMMGLDIDDELCRDNLFKVLDKAQKTNNFVRIDMEGSDYTQATIDIFKQAYKKYGKHVGIVLQAYLHRTKEDVRDLADMGADVRLCKGAYSEPERIALQNMNAIRDAFKEYAEVLLEKTSYPRIATHDDELIKWTLDYTDRNNIGPSRFEFQMLYGLRQTTMEDLTEDGYNSRIYVPYGTMWFPYFKRRLMERKENIWFILTTMFQR